MANLRILAGVLGLAVLLAATSCGQSDAPQATLEVSSVPAAEIYVDGVSRGTSPATLSLSAGDHRVELRLEKFESFETRVTLAADEKQAIDASLVAQDPSDPEVIASLAEAEGVDVAPFVAPEVTRGSRRSAVAVLLWPARDLRKEGLVSYAIEADETYEGDATLEFRHGRKVLYRESFNPETITTVRSMPAEVLEHARIGRKFTWGLYFEDRRRPITAEFRIVQRKKAENQLARLDKSRHVARQPEITQQILRATVLENNRLYTEALVLNLKIAAAHPNSTQPYRGIVTTLRRLDADESELFAFVSPNVGGKGGHAGLVRPAGRTAANSLGIEAWSPVQPGPVPTPAATPDAPRPGTTAQGVTPSTQPGATPEAEQPTPATGPEPTRVDPQAEAVAQMREALERESHALDDAQQQAEAAERLANESREAAEAADRQAQEAEAAAAAARQAVEQTDEPTAEQLERMHDTGVEAEEAREAAARAGTAAEEAEASLRQAQHEVAQRTTRVDEMRQALEAAARTAGTAPAVEPVPTPPTDQPQADRATLEQNLQDAERHLEATNAEFERARTELEKAQQAHESDPTDENRQRLMDAERAAEAAGEDARKAQEQLEAARRALAEIGDRNR